MSGFFNAHFGNFGYRPCNETQCAIIKVVMPKDLGEDIMNDLLKRLAPQSTGRMTRMQIIEKMTTRDERVLYEWEIYPGESHSNSRNREVEEFVSRLPHEIKGFFERYGKHKHYIQQYGKKDEKRDKKQKR